MRTLISGLIVAALSIGPAAAQHTSGQGATAQRHGAAPQGRVGQLIEQLRGGGLVLVIRHERTEVPSREDDYTRPAHECTVQRNLSIAAMAGAQETGVSLRALEISVAAVISSPMCRATETARFMFGCYAVEPRLIHENPGVEGGRDGEQAGREFAEVLRALPRIPGNTALVSHAGNIQRATGIRLAEGEIGVLRIEPDGRFTIVGQVLGSDLGPYARLALSQAR
jgi:broad specificity phosphatase PhoE